jgi:hypothetical protein
LSWTLWLGVVALVSHASLVLASSPLKADFNGDGYADLAIGVPDEDVSGMTNAGSVHVAYGSASGITTSGSQVFSQGVGGVPDQSEAGDLFGLALGAGDFHGDGYADLAIGVLSEDLGSTANAGSVIVLYARDDGRGWRRLDLANGSRQPRTAAALSRERQPLAQQFVQHDPQGIDVGGGRDRLAAHLLRCGVVGGQQADMHVREDRGRVLVGEQPRNAEVEQLQLAVARHQHVGGLQVAMDDQLRVRLLNGPARVGASGVEEGAPLPDGTLEGLGEDLGHASGLRLGAHRRRPARGSARLGFRLLVDLAEEPGPRQRPVPLDGARGLFERRRCLLDAQAGEEAAFDDHGLARIGRGEPRGGTVEVDQLGRETVHAHLDPVDVHGLLPAPTLEPPPATGGLDQDPSHGAGRGAEEVGAVAGRDLFGVHEAQVGLVHEAGGVEREAVSLALELAVGHRAQLRVDEPRQLVQGAAIRTPRLCPARP